MYARKLQINLILMLFTFTLYKHLCLTSHCMSVNVMQTCTKSTVHVHVHVHVDVGGWRPWVRSPTATLFFFLLIQME